MCRAKTGQKPHRARKTLGTMKRYTVWRKGPRRPMRLSWRVRFSTDYAAAKRYHGRPLADGTLLLRTLGPQRRSAMPLQPKTIVLATYLAVFACPAGATARDENDDVRDVAALADKLKDKDPDVRRKAAAGLGNIGPKGKDAASREDLGPAVKAAAEVLAGVLKDENAGVRLQAAQALRSLDRGAKPAVAALAGAMKDEDAAVRGAAASALERIGPEARAALPALADALKDDDKDVRRNAAFALARFRRAAAPVLAGALKSRNKDDRVTGAQALQYIGPEAEAAIPALAVALKDKDPGVRDAAAWAFERMGPAAKAAVPALAEALNDKEATVRHSAAGALASIGGMRRRPCRRSLPYSKTETLTIAM